MPTNRVAAVIGFSLLFCQIASADVVVPSGFAATEGGVGLSFDERTAFTSQYIFPAAEIGLNVGDTITGLRWRLDLDAPNPVTGNIAWSDFNIVLGQGTGTVASPSLTFADNITNALSVRSGALALDLGSFDNSGPTPNDFGTEIVFDNQYTYSGGDLVIEWRATAPAIDDPNITLGVFGQFVDAVGSFSGPSPETNGSSVFTEFEEVDANLATAGTDIFGVLPVFELSVTPVPEPASLVGLGLVASGLIAAGRKERRGA